MPLSVRVANRIFAVFVAALVGTGALVGHAFSGYARLETFKLLNIVGLAYDLIGILVLSEAVTQSAPLKKFMVNWVARVLLWAHTVVPLGALIGVGIGHSLPSAGATARFFASFFAYSLLVLGLIDSTVTYPRFGRFQGLEFRRQAFGLILLITGVVVQLIAAIQDLSKSVQP